MIWQSNHEPQTELRANAADGYITSINTNYPPQNSGSQMDVHTNEKNFANEVPSKVESVMTTVATGVHDAVLTVIEKLVKPRVELAMSTVIASSGRGADSVVLDSDLRVFLRQKLKVFKWLF